MHIQAICTFLFASLLTGQAQVPEKSTQSNDTTSARVSVRSPFVEKQYRNSLEAGLRFEKFADHFNDRAFQYIQYGRKIDRVDVLTRAMFYQFGSSDGLQLETDVYWKFRKQGYADFGATYSNDLIFPNYRLRAEIFQNKGRFEYSVGAGLVKPYQFREIPIITATLGYYFSDYLVFVRPTFTHVDNGFSKSILVQARRYLNKHDFVALSLMRGADTGTSRNINAIANTFGLETYLIRVNSHVRVSDRYKIGVGVDHGGIYIPESSVYARFFGVDFFINRTF